MLGGIEQINTGNDRVTRVPAEHRGDTGFSPDTRQAERFGRSDQLILSAEARSHMEQSNARYSSSKGLSQGKKPEAALRVPGKEEQKQEKRRKISGAEDLSSEEKSQVQELKRTDQKVRSHELAHMASAGGYAQGGPSYEYTMGPDGKQYAVGGEVKIDTSPINDNPEATIAKAQVIRNAALAPAEPSGADMSVAAAASEMEASARRQIQERKTKGTEEPVPGAPKIKEPEKTEKTELHGQVAAADQNREERQADNEAENRKILSRIFPNYQPYQGGSQLDIMA